MKTILVIFLLILTGCQQRYYGYIKGSSSYHSGISVTTSTREQCLEIKEERKLTQTVVCPEVVD